MPVNRRIWIGRAAVVLLMLASRGYAQGPSLRPEETLAEVWQIVDQNFFDPTFQEVFFWPTKT